MIDAPERVEIAVLACPGSTLPSGLPLDPCLTCLRRSAEVVAIGLLLQPAVKWVETQSKVGYECKNHRR